jgi:hypothetical protein
MPGAGYEFTLSMSRAYLWVACLGAALGVVGGTALVAAPHVAELAPAVARVGVELSLEAGWAPIAFYAGGGAVLVLSALSLRRSLVYANDCRVGDAGIFARTLTNVEEFIPWPRFRGARVSGRLIRIDFDTEEGVRDCLYIEAPWRAGATLLRIRTFLAEKERALAAAKKRAAEAPRPEAAQPVEG